MTDQSDAALAGRLQALPIAQQYFDLCHLEYRLDAAVLAVFGVEYESDQPWPCTHMVYDDYDSSFELWGIKDPEWMPTPEQMAAAFALGFARCWLVYGDGQERYCTPGTIGAKHPCSHPRESEQKYQLAKLRAALQEAPHAPQLTDHDLLMLGIIGRQHADMGNEEEVAAMRKYLATKGQWLPQTVKATPRPFHDPDPVSADRPRAVGEAPHAHPAPTTDTAT